MRKTEKSSDSTRCLKLDSFSRNAYWEIWREYDWAMRRLGGDEATTNADRLEYSLQYSIWDVMDPGECNYDRFDI